MSPSQSASGTDLAVFLPADDGRPVSGPLTGEDRSAESQGSKPLVVFLRGPDASDHTWAVLDDLAAKQSWVATRSRTQAWHLARGRMTTVLVDFAGVRLEDTQGAVRIGVGRVLAKYDVTTGRVPVSELLSAAERERLADEPWLTTLVEHEHREPVLPAKGGITTVELPTSDGGSITLKPLVAAVRNAAAAR